MDKARIHSLLSPGDKCLVQVHRKFTKSKVNPSKKGYNNSEGFPESE